MCLGIDMLGCTRRSIRMYISSVTYKPWIFVIIYYCDTVKAVTTPSCLVAPDCQQIVFWSVRDELFNKARTWDRENIWVPDRNRTHDFPNTWRALYPLSYENSWRARSFDWVHMWQSSCILLGSTLSNSSWVVISQWRWWRLSSVMKCERWIIQHDTSVGQRKYLIADLWCLDL